jgi:replicative DNA helicase
MAQHVSNLDPPLPHSRDAEVAFLGAILLGSGGPAEIELLDSMDFFLPFHRTIHRHMKRLVAEGKPPNDPVLLLDSLSAANELETAGGAAYISQLPDGLPKLSNLSHYARIIKDKSELDPVFTNIGARPIDCYRPMGMHSCYLKKMRRHSFHTLPLG